MILLCIYGSHLLWRTSKWYIIHVYVGTILYFNEQSFGIPFLMETRKNIDRSNSRVRLKRLRKSPTSTLLQNVRFELQLYRITENVLTISTRIANISPVLPPLYIPTDIVTAVDEYRSTPSAPDIIFWTHRLGIWIHLATY